MDNPGSLAPCNMTSAVRTLTWQTTYFGIKQHPGPKNCVLDSTRRVWTNLHLAMVQNHVPPVSIPIPTKIGSKMGGAPTPKWDPKEVLTHSHFSRCGGVTRPVERTANVQRQLPGRPSAVGLAVALAAAWRLSGLAHAGGTRLDR